MKQSFYIVTVLIVAWLAIGLAFYIYNYDLIDSTQRSLSRAVHHIELPFDQIDRTYSPTTLRKKLTKPGLICFKENSNLGDFSCSAHIKSVSGVEALRVAYFFKNDRLNLAKVDLLNWKHTDGKKLLLRRYGQPSAEQKSLSQIVPIVGTSLQGTLLSLAERALAKARLVEWKTANGSVYYNADRPLNFAQWNTILFVPKP